MAGTRSFTRYAKRILSRWYYFILALLLALPAAFLYLYLTPPQYDVQASIMVAAPANKQEPGTEVSDDKDPLPRGIVDDQVGILTSNTILEKSLRDLDFGVAYCVENQLAVREEYENSYFKVKLDSSVNQAIDVPVYVKRISSTRYHVKVSARDVQLYNCFSNKVEGSIPELEINEEVPLDKPLGNKYLNFRIAFNDKYKVEAGDQMFFIIRPLHTLVASYQNNLTAEPISADSKIVSLTVRGEVPEKEKVFLGSLIQQYFQLSSATEQGTSLQALKFIEDQLNNPPDTLSEKMRAYLADKRIEMRMALASASTSKSVVDKPFTASGGNPVFPLTDVVYGIAIASAFLIVILATIIKDKWRDTLLSAEDVELTTKIPLVATISHAKKREQNTIVAHARSAVGESFRSLRVNLQYLTLDAGANVIGITSSRESEGKTFCAVNLAAVMAYSGRRTVLIDTDMRRPRVASYFQLENRKGLSNFLVGDGSIKEIINNTEHKGFDVIGSGPIPPNPIDLIGNPRMEELINSLRQSYSTVIIDSPPLGYVSEYIILMKYTDANLYVVRSDYTNRKSLKRLNKLLEREKVGNFNIVLNDVRPSKESGNYYAYGYGYGYKY
ncbi:CpsD/CapB family tyrosine-protein kinase [Chryseolinea sp. T2]|uniref:tyrosine-protein kinase domain-containing protein n=1 Tax=Chryseolinea sp. T2 TaxID=3129255 RepID=UPI003076E775